MKRTIHTLCTAALLLAATACEDTLQTEGPAATGDGPTLTLRIDNSGEDTRTRTTLDSADPKHNVQRIRILIFRGEGDNATFFAAEEAQWPATEGGERPNSMTYTLQKALVAGQTYTLLGVGMDDTFSDTYAIDQNETLDKTYARLKEGKTPARCEFFTGTVSFTQAGKNTQIDDLHLRRRVAGAMLYVNEIPQLVDGKRVTSVKLELGAPQNSSVLLKRDFADKEWREPEGQTPMEETSKVLAAIDLSGYAYRDGQDFYIDSEGKPATGYAGVYLLPLNKTENTPTFTVRLYGKALADTGAGNGEVTGEETQLSKEFIVENRNESNATAFDIRSNYIYCIGKLSPEQGIDAPISLSGEALYVEVQEWQKVETGHDFGPARVQAVFDDKDNPIHNCINEEFPIKILLPLSTIQKDVTKITINVNEESYISYQPGIATAEEEDFYKNWLYIKDPEGGNTYSQGTYTLFDSETSAAAGKTIAEMPQELTVFIKDYARPRADWGWHGKKWAPEGKEVDYINNDVRYVDIILSTYITRNGKELLPRMDTLRITQYNTITVNYKAEEDNEVYEVYCGFSREDVKKDDGTEFLDGWGYWDQENIDIYYGIFNDEGEGNIGSTGSRHNGAFNLFAIDYGNVYKNSWKGSAPQTAHHLIRKIDTADNTMVSSPETSDKAPYPRTEVGWYLPAEFELEGFTIMCGKAELGDKLYKDKFEMKEYQSYWCSTLPGGTTDFTGIFYRHPNLTIGTVDNRGDEDWERCSGYSRVKNNQGTAENPCYLRSARKFPEYYNYAW